MSCSDLIVFDIVANRRFIGENHASCKVLFNEKVVFFTNDNLNRMRNLRGMQYSEFSEALKGLIEFWDEKFSQIPNTAVINSYANPLLFEFLENFSEVQFNDNLFSRGPEYLKEFPKTYVKNVPRLYEYTFERIGSQWYFKTRYEIHTHSTRNKKQA